MSSETRPIKVTNLDSEKIMKVLVFIELDDIFNCCQSAFIAITTNLIAEGQGFSKINLLVLAVQIKSFVTSLFVQFGSIQKLSRFLFFSNFKDEAKKRIMRVCKQAMSMYKQNS